MRLYGNAAVAIQPARGYNIDPKSTYHDPALVPPHGYLALYAWLRLAFGADAIIHNGKHGNLEWLPGKAVALSGACYPEIAHGPLPQLYPFIVNDPGEGTQAKRRTSAVIIDHLTPPLTRAETYGPLKDLEALVDEYYLASGLDRRRRDALKRDILDLTRSSRLDLDAGFTGDDEADLQRLDAYLCDLKEAQIRDGLHILGESPDRAARDRSSRRARPRAARPRRRSRPVLDPCPEHRLRLPGVRSAHLRHGKRVDRARGLRCLPRSPTIPGAAPATPWNGSKLTRCISCHRGSVLRRKSSSRRPSPFSIMSTPRCGHRSRPADRPRSMRC